MNQINEETIALAERCRRISTSTWSDALDACGTAGVMDGIERRTGSGRIAGPAVTIRESVNALGGYPPEEFAVGRLLAAGGQNDVLVVEMGGAAVSTFGGLAARAASLRGISAVIVDGGCRDIDELGPSGLWVGSRHVTPRSGKRRVRVEEVNGAIKCGGVTVMPGDIVVGDDTGIVVIPAVLLVRVLPLAEELEQREPVFRQALAASEEFAEVARRLGHI